MKKRETMKGVKRKDGKEENMKSKQFKVEKRGKYGKG